MAPYNAGFALMCLADLTRKGYEACANVFYKSQYFALCESGEWGRRCNIVKIKNNSAGCQRQCKSDGLVEHP